MLSTNNGENPTTYQQKRDIKKKFDNVMFLSPNKAFRDFIIKGKIIFSTVSPFRCLIRV